MNQMELYRHIIDGCDEALLDAFLRRMEMSLKVAESKLEAGDSIFVPDREERILDDISHGLTPELALKAQSLWRSLMRMSRGRQYHYFITHDRERRLSFEADLHTQLPDGPVLCAQNDARQISSALGLEAQPCGSIAIALDGLEKGQSPWAALALDDFYDSDWLFSMIFERRMYVNSIVKATGGKHVFLLSQNLYDRPENDMVTIAFAVRTDQHGSLAQTLEVFSDLKINIEYLRFKTRNINDDNRRRRNIVFADLNGQITSTPMRTALFQLECEAPFFRMLGYRQRLNEV